MHCSDENEAQSDHRLESCSVCPHQSPQLCAANATSQTTYPFPKSRLPDVVPYPHIVGLEGHQKCQMATRLTSLGKQRRKYFSAVAGGSRHPVIEAGTVNNWTTDQYATAVDMGFRRQTTSDGWLPTPEGSTVAREQVAKVFRYSAVAVANTPDSMLPKDPVSLARGYHAIAAPWHACRVRSGIRCIHAQ